MQGQPLLLIHWEQAPPAEFVGIAIASPPVPTPLYSYIHDVITYSMKCILSWMYTDIPVLHFCVSHVMLDWFGPWWDCHAYFLRFPECVNPAATFWETRCISANQVSIPTVLLMGPIFNVSDLLAFRSFRCEYVIMLFPRMRQPIILTMAILSHLFCRFCQETNCCQCVMAYSPDSRIMRDY